MIQIDITADTLTSIDNNKVYPYYFVDLSTKKVYEVLMGGEGCLARAMGEVAKLVKNRFNVKYIRKDVKSHQKFFK